MDPDVYPPAGLLCSIHQPVKEFSKAACMVTSLAHKSLTVIERHS
jgi:hypothetical protein